MVPFDLGPRDLSMVTDAGDIIVPAGKYTMTVGGGQPGSGLPTLAGAFNVRSQTKLPE